MKLKDLRCEYRVNPLGIDVNQPRLSWKLDAPHRGAGQTALQVVAACDLGALQKDGPVLWDSGKVDSDQSTQFPYAGPALQSRQRVYWHVRVWDEHGHPTAWSDPAWFEMGLLTPEDWSAQWIANPLVGGKQTPVPSPFFRKEFSVDPEIQSARLYITSLGIYEPSINGQRIGKDVFSPGWTDYNQRLQYQTYDVTNLMKDGPNVIGAILGDGWYCGHIAWEGRQIYGERPKLLAQLEILQADGTVQQIVTDQTWQTAVGPILEADLIMGEAYDARLTIPAWNLPPTSNSQSLTPTPPWTPALTLPHPAGLSLIAQNSPTVQPQEELVPIKDPQPAGGRSKYTCIFDFGQNLVGRVRLTITGARGQTITLRYGEMLDQNGGLYTENLRAARQTDYYTLAGDPEGEVWESQFTFHGFRYVLVDGLTEPPDRNLLRAIVLHAAHSPAIQFECADPLINQLQHNIQWGWKGNSIDIPTDCPQRDERLGWTGDAQVFAKTATYLTDAAGFFTKWVQDMVDAQLAYGALPAVAPATPMFHRYDGGAAWSDAFIIVPWTVWQQYGDRRILETQYAAMCRYMDYLVENSPGLIRMLPSKTEINQADEDGHIGGYGDWLAQDGHNDLRGLTPKDLIGTAFLAYDAQLMSQIATALDKPADAARFQQLFADTRAAFVKRFITPDGLLAGQTQTAHVLALHFDLVPEHLRKGITDALVADITSRQMHMSTGFVGTPYICQVLSQNGYLDLAYTLLLQKTFPSWLYSVRHGATTIWERWDGWTEENGFHDPGMNSFNHYAYGAVGTWMYENISGIRTNPQAPGFKHFILQPQMNARMSFARAAYPCPYGVIESHWRMAGTAFIWDVVIPPNTGATAYLPGESPAQILEGNRPLDESPDLTIIRQTAQFTVVELSSGSYHFKVC